MTAHTEDPGLHELSAELLHRYQGDAVLWGKGDMLLLPRRLRTGGVVGTGTADHILWTPGIQIR